MRPLDEVCVDRRAIIAALPGLILLPGVVAACSSSTPPAATSPAAESPASPAASPAAPAEAKGTQVAITEVPVGAAVVVSGPPPYVVAQPTQGQFVAFSAACTHRGTTVKVDTGTTLKCPAHGSEFNADTGAVLKGPAASPLKSVPVVVDNEMLTIGG